MQPALAFRRQGRAAALAALGHPHYLSNVHGTNAITKINSPHHQHSIPLHVGRCYTSAPVALSLSSSVFSSSLPCCSSSVVTCSIPLTSGM